MYVTDCFDDGDLADRFRKAVQGEESVVLSTPRQCDVADDFGRAVIRGFSASPRWLDCRFLYDAVGSQLYEQITEQPEYYPTRTEEAILDAHADEIRALTGPVTLIELGSGSSAKTDHLLRAYIERDREVRYVPIDVSGQALLDAGRAIRTRRPEVQVVGVNGTYHDAMPLFGHASPVMVVFLGSTVGNLNDEDARRFWQQIAFHLEPDDFFLLGVDLVKDVALLEAAYNDAAGVSARFSLNLFHRMNRDLGAGLDVDRIEHFASWNAEAERIDIKARFLSDQVVEIPAFDRRFPVAVGEEILVEISRKFRLETLKPFLKEFGFSLRQVFTDDREWFALLLLDRQGTQ